MSDNIRFSNAGGDAEMLEATSPSRAQQAATRRAQLQADIERFLAKGGTVTTVDTTVHGNVGALDMDPLHGHADHKTKSLSGTGAAIARRRMANIMRASVEEAFARRQEKDRA